MGWPDEQAQQTEPGISSHVSESNWYQKDQRKLVQSSREYSVLLTNEYQDTQLSFFGLKVNDQLEFSDGHNYVAVGDNHNEWLFKVGQERWGLTGGNRELKLSLNFNLWQWQLSQKKESQKISIDAQDELDAPSPQQFIFEHNWLDRRWGLQVSHPSFSVRYSQFETASHDYQWSGEFKFKQWRHRLDHHKIDFNYGQADLVDEYYSYGEFEWQNYGENWHWLSHYQQADYWWSLSVIKQDVSFKTRGNASLINVIGPSAHLAGANWSWGVQGNFNSEGLKFAYGWKNQNWQHSWHLGLNKLRPFVNSKIYKNVILIGLPSLDEEEELDIKYTVLTQLGWRSQYKWQQFTIGASFTQLIPIYIEEKKELDEEIKPSDPTQSDTASNNSDNHHTGYTIALYAIWHF